MSKLYLTILIFAVTIAAATTVVVLKIKNSKETAPNSKLTSAQPISIEKINQLITQADGYEAKLKITSGGKIYTGHVYVSSDKAKTVYQIGGERFFSVIDINKNEIVNYNLKSKKGLRIPCQTEEKESIFKKIPDVAEIIKTSEIINGIDCWVVEIKHEDKTEILWISKEDGIVVKIETTSPQEETIFELTEVKNTTEEIEIPEEIEIIDLFSEEFISFIQEESDASTIASLPSLPSVSVEPTIIPSTEPADQEPIQEPSEQPEESTPATPQTEYPSATSIPSLPEEGIYEETHPKLPIEIVPIY